MSRGVVRTVGVLLFLLILAAVAGGVLVHRRDDRQAERSPSYLYGTEVEHHYAQVSSPHTSVRADCRLHVLAYAEPRPTPFDVDLAVRGCVDTYVGLND